MQNATTNIPDIDAAHSSGNLSLFAPENAKLLLEGMQEQLVPSGTYLFWEGEAADRLYYVVKGSVSLLKSNEEGKSLMMRLFREGDLFGRFEPGLSAKHQMSAKTMEPSVIGIIPVEELECRLIQHPFLSFDMMKWMSVNYQIQETRLRDLMMFGKSGALCSTLIRLSNTYGLRNGGQIQINRKLTHAELSEMIGATRESVNRMLADLRKCGAVDTENGRIVIKDIAYLETVCHCEHCPKPMCRM
jgi:CRP/FNR family transcriptional regulator